MRIIYHHRTLADGAEGIHITSMVEAFRSLGHEVLVRGLAGSDGSLGRPGLVDKVRNTLPAWAAEVSAACLNVPELIDARRSIRQWRADVVYKRHARYDIATLAAARWDGVPTILEVNSLFSQGAYHEFEPLALRSLAARFERYALSLASVVIAVSTPLADQIRTLARRPVHVLPNGADPNYFDIGQAGVETVRRRHRLAGKTTIGWVGILRQWHGLELLLEAVSTIPEAQLLLVGDGPARHAIEERADALGLAGRMIITGRVEHREVRDHVAAFDVAVVPDERTGVASPMKLVEYMSMARAVVAPRLDNIRDLIDDGADGLLFEQGNAGALAAVLRAAIDDPGLRLRLGGAARRKVELERNWRAIAIHALRLAATDASATGGTIPP